MNESSFLGLIQNAALLLAMALIFDRVAFRWQTGKPRLFQIPVGLLLGGIGMVLMLTPWVFIPGLNFDTRSILLSISGLFFGTVPTLIAMGMTAVFRIYQGGLGTLMGVSVILATGTIGIAWRHLRRHPLDEITGRELYLFGIVVHLVMLAFVITLPWETVFQVFSTISLPVLVINPIGTALLGFLMGSRLRREQSSEALKESQERLRLAVEASNIGFFDRDLVTNQIHFSPEWKKQIGYGVDEITNDSKEWQNRVHPDDLQEVLYRVNAFIQGLRPVYEAEYRLRHKDGSYRWILARGSLECDKSGKAMRLLGCHIDITRQKQDEEAILASERRFRGLAESSQDYIMLYDREYRYVYENPAALQVSGLSEADIIGKTHREAGFSEEESTVREADIQQVFASGSSSQRLFEWGGAEGKVILDWRLSPVFSADGKVELVLGISRDITTLKQAEKALQESENRLRFAMDGANDGLWDVQLKTNEVYLSPRGCEILGYSPDELHQIVNIWFQLGHPDDMIETTKRLNDHLEGRSPIFEIEQRLQMKSGEWKWVLTRGKLVERDLDGRPLRMTGTHTDITTRKQAAEKVQAAQAELQRLLSEADQSRQALLSLVEDQKQAEEHIRQLNLELEQRVRDRTTQLESANTELEAFAYSVSHDLRAPLRAMDGFSAVLLKDYPNQLDEKGRHYLDRIQEASRRMGQLINDLLSLSRVTRTDFKRQQVDLSALAREIVDNLQAQDPQRPVVFDISSNLIVQGDAHLLKIVLENLLNNAYKFTSQHEQARIQVGVIEQAGEWVYFVRDNGVGFDMNYAGKLFAPFQRLHSMQEFPGTGIGLVTVQRIIHRHGGRIWPEAAVGQGATFYFTLGDE